MIANRPPLSSREWPPEQEPPPAAKLVVERNPQRLKSTSRRMNAPGTPGMLSARNYSIGQLLRGSYRGCSRSRAIRLAIRLAPASPYSKIKSASARSVRYDEIGSRLSAAASIRISSGASTRS